MLWIWLTIMWCLQHALASERSMWFGAASASVTRNFTLNHSLSTEGNIDCHPVLRRSLPGTSSTSKWHQMNSWVDNNIYQFGSFVLNRRRVWHHSLPDSVFRLNSSPDLPNQYTKLWCFFNLRILSKKTCQKTSLYELFHGSSQFLFVGTLTFGYHLGWLDHTF